jgi:hypothetical protein
MKITEKDARAAARLVYGDSAALVELHVDRLRKAGLLEEPTPKAVETHSASDEAERREKLNRQIESAASRGLVVHTAAVDLWDLDNVTRRGNR